MTVHRLRSLLLAGVLALVVIGGAQVTGALDALEHDSIDLRFSLRAEHTPDDVVVVAVDDVTFSDLGEQWPFDRRRFAKATELLDAAGARQIVYDIQFTEQSGDAEADWAFYEAIGEANGAILATSETDGEGGHNIFGGDENLREIHATAAASNLPDEHSGVIRRFGARVDGLPTIAAAVAEREGKRLPRHLFDREDGAWIDFRGGPGTITTVSFSDLVQQRANPSLFKDKVVVVGASAPTLQDVHPTSTARSELMSGPEIQANAIWTALHGVPLRPAPGWLTVLAIVLLTLVVPFASMRLHPLAAVLAGIGVAVLYAVGAWLAFTGGVIVAVVAPLLGGAIATVTTAVIGQLVERRARRRVAAYNAELEAAVRERTADLDALQLEIIERLGQAVDSRDEETGEHINRIGTLSFRLARAIGMDLDRAEMLRRASAMHDVGKIAIPDAILRKRGPLDTDEWREMKLHPEHGERIVEAVPDLGHLGRSIRAEHERWDGGGYPDGLSGEEVPLSSRIVLACDAFLAMVERRPYRRSLTPSAARRELQRHAGTQFDPRVVEALLDELSEPAAA